VGGVFRRYGAVGRTGLVGIDLRTAALLPWDPDVRGGSVNALATYGDNWLLVGGDFLMAAGAVRGGIASFDTSSHTLTSFHPARLHPKALAVGGETLYALETSSVPLHAIDLASGNSVAGFDPPVFGESPEHLAIAGDRLYVGGRFSTVGGQPRPGLASLNRITGSLQPWNPTLGGEMRWAGGVAVAGETLYSGFYRAMDGGVAAISLNSGAATDLGLRFRAPDYVPGYTVPSPPVAFAIQDGLLFAGGYFDTINNGPRAGLAAIDLSNNGVTGWSPGGRSPVTVLLARPGLLVAGSSSAEPALFPLTGTGTPEPPTSVSATAVDTTATISWRPPPVGPRPTGYSLEAGTAAGLRDIVTVPVSGTSLTATAPPGRYFLRVRSVTSAGAGYPAAMWSCWWRARHQVPR
jgi:hypothetical protein